MNAETFRHLPIYRNITYKFRGLMTRATSSILSASFLHICLEILNNEKKKKLFKFQLFDNDVSDVL